MQVKRLTINAMLIAMYVVLGFVSVNLGNMKITLDSLPILVGAALFGPVDGLLIGLLGSFINQMTTWGFTATTVLWILPAGARGAMVGAYAKRRGFDMTVRETVFIAITSALVVTALNTLVMYLDGLVYGFYGSTIYVYLFGAIVPRIVVGVVTAGVFAGLLPMLLRLIRAAAGIAQPGGVQGNVEKEGDAAQEESRDAKN